MRIGSVITHSAQAVAEGALIALLVVGMMAGTTLAAKNTAGGHGKPGGGGSGGTATLVVSPNPVPTNTSFRITGCGYTPNVGIKFVQYNPDGTAVFGGMTDAAGCVFVGLMQ